MGTMLKLLMDGMDEEALYQVLNRAAAHVDGYYEQVKQLEKELKEEKDIANATVTNDSAVINDLKRKEEKLGDLVKKHETEIMRLTTENIKLQHELRTQVKIVQGLRRQKGAVRNILAGTDGEDDNSDTSASEDDIILGGDNGKRPRTRTD
jgi:hypothetical protein